MFLSLCLHFYEVQLPQRTERLHRETHESSHILQFASVASLAKADASPSPTIFTQCHYPAVTLWLKEGATPGYWPDGFLHLFSHKLQGEKVRRLSLSPSSIQRDKYQWVDILASLLKVSRSQGSLHSPNAGDKVEDSLLWIISLLCLRTWLQCSEHFKWCNFVLRVFLRSSV